MKQDTGSDGVVLTADKPVRESKLPRFAVPRRAKGAASESKEPEDKIYGPSPRRLTWGAAALSLAVLVPCVATGVVMADNRELKEQYNHVLSIASSASYGSAPGGFAARCVELWLRSGSVEREPATASPVAVGDPTQAFIDNCNPGVSADDLKGQLPNMLQATSVYAEESGLSYPDPSVLGLWSVTVCASVSAYQKGQAPGSGAFEPLDLLCYRVGVYTDPETQRSSLRGLPRQVPRPVSSTAPALTIAMAQADLNEPRTSLMQSYLSASLPVPPEDRLPEGDVSRFFLPGVPALPVHSSSVESVVVTKAGFRAREDGSVDAVALVRVTHKGGAVSLQQFPFVLSQEGSRWSIAGLPGSPLLDSVSEVAPGS